MVYFHCDTNWGEVVCEYVERTVCVTPEWKSGTKGKIIAHKHHESFQHLRRASQQRAMLALCFFLLQQTAIAQLGN